jgi:hypothetical protein
VEKTEYTSAVPAQIPSRGVLRSQEVCEIVEVQPYVLKSWEAEFPELGVSKTPDGPRIYRRADVELVVKLKELLFVEGLTLAGARRRLIAEGLAAATPSPEDVAISDSDVAALLDKQARRGLRDVREGLGFILEVLNSRGKPATGRSRPAGAAARRPPAKPEKVRSKRRLSSGAGRGKHVAPGLHTRGTRGKRTARPARSTGKRRR